MTASEVAHALGGRRNGQTWMARCPAHEDGTPSLSLRDGADGRLLARCFAGCGQRDVIAALRARGLWSGGRCGSPTHRDAQERIGLAEEVRRRSDRALAIWHSAQPAAGTAVEVYLATRGLVLPNLERIRFHRDLRHPNGGRWPAMVALVTRGRDDGPLGIHRTFLTPSGTAKAPVEPQKMMLGPARGGAVRLAPPGPGLLVGEGIETCLAAMLATGRPAWAALSTAGLRTLDLPEGVEEVTILADGDDPGEAAAHAAASRWRIEGRRVRIARPPVGKDFNDALLAATAEHEAAA